MKRELHTEVSQQEEASPSLKMVKLSVSKQDSPISKQLSRECVEAIQFYNKHYPARLFELMDKFINSRLSENAIKAEYILLESKLKIFQPLLVKHSSNKPVFLRVQEFQTKYFETFEIIKSFLFCHKVASSTANSQEQHAQTITRINEWIAHYNYEKMGTIIFLNSLTDPNVRKNMLIELQFHIHFLSTLKHYIHKATQQYPALTYEDHLKNNTLSNLVTESLDEINAIFHIINASKASIPAHIIQHANILVNNIKTLDNIEKLQTIIEKLQHFQADTENAPPNSQTNTKLAQYLELIQNIIQETTPIIVAINAVSDYIYGTNFSDETLYFFNKLVTKEQHLSRQLESLNQIKIQFESMVSENNRGTQFID